MHSRYLAAGLAALVLVLVTGACSDDDSNGPGPRAELRVVHASPDAPDVDVLVDDKSALTGVPYKAFSGFLSVAAGSRNIKVNAAGEAPAGQYQVRITPAGSKTPALDTGALTLAAGQIRTAIAVEAVGGGVPLAALLLADKN